MATYPQSEMTVSPATTNPPRIGRYSIRRIRVNDFSDDLTRYVIHSKPAGSHPVETIDNNEMIAMWNNIASLGVQMGFSPLVYSEGV